MGRHVLRLHLHDENLGIIGSVRRARLPGHGNRGSARKPALQTKYFVSCTYFARVYQTKRIMDEAMLIMIPYLHNCWHGFDLLSQKAGFLVVP
jgi:arginine/lysine/ornithine decarboxylase